MFQFFWTRAASVWVAALYIAMGVLLFAFPAATGTFFVWALAGGAAAYGVSHLVRYLQGRKAGAANPGDLFLTVLPAAFSVFALIWPQAILSVLPLVLGSLLLVDGIGKLPLAITGLREQFPGMIPLALSSVVPIVLGALIVINPFAAVRIAVMVFGAALVADGVSDLALAILDPENTRSRGFYIPDAATPKLREIRAAKKQVEEQLYRAQTDAEKDDLRQKRVRICAEEDSEEMKVRRAMGAALAPMADDLLADADTAGRLDFLIQKALFAHRFGGVRPELTDTALELTDMINPELCDLLQEQGRAFVPVSISLDRGAAVITGANMGGKSVAMKTVALNVLLLQAGFLVCARSARMPLFWSVHMLFDDLQSIQSGLSGFGSEIVQFQKALAEVEQGYSLFLLDEFARGTNPDEGAIIVQAVTRYLNDVNAISLLTTHYDKVAEHARIHYQIIGLRDVDPEQIRRELAATNEDGVAVIARHMNYGLYRVEGRSDCPRDALNICRMLSLKPEILEKIEQSY